MLNDKKKLFWIILSSFLLIPLIVSVISSIHVIKFFELSNFKTLAIALSVSFEIGALSALAGLVVMDKINKNIIYFIFILLTAYQMMGNTYYAYEMLSQKMITNPNLINNWTELFGFEVDDIILMKRIIAIISGAILPIVSLCFLDLSVDYIKKSFITEQNQSDDFKKKVNSEETNEIKESDTIVTIKKNDLEVGIPLNEPVIEKLDTQDEPIVEESTTQNGTLLEYKPIIDEPIIDEPKVVSEQPEVISEEEKKDIREKNKKSNRISMGGKNGFHNLVYTK